MTPLETIPNRLPNVSGLVVGILAGTGRGARPRPPARRCGPTGHHRLTERRPSRLHCSGHRRRRARLRQRYDRMGERCVDRRRCLGGHAELLIPLRMNSPVGSITMPGALKLAASVRTSRHRGQNGPTTLGSGSPHVHPSRAASHRSSRSEALQPTAPPSCPHSEGPHWRVIRYAVPGQLLARGAVCSDAPAESVAPRLTSGLVSLVEDPRPGFSTRFSTSPRLRSSGDRAPLS